MKVDSKFHAALNVAFTTFPPPHHLLIYSFQPLLHRPQPHHILLRVRKAGHKPHIPSRNLPLGRIQRTARLLNLLQLLINARHGDRHAHRHPLLGNIVRVQRRGQQVLLANLREAAVLLVRLARGVEQHEGGFLDGGATEGATVPAENRAVEGGGAGHVRDGNLGPGYGVVLYRRAGLVKCRGRMR